MNEDALGKFKGGGPCRFMWREKGRPILKLQLVELMSLAPGPPPDDKHC
jgi:hypothetical protein